MTLRRTTSALFSLSIFYRVDIVVFCEGGTPISYEDAMKTSHTDGTLDALYWDNIITTYNMEKKYHVKSVGSKTTLKKIAEDVRSNNLSSITICMDSDYDRILGTNYNGPRVAWTKGYSWENDVVSFSVLEEIVSMLVGGGTSSAEIIHDFRERASCLERQLQRWTEIDISLCARGQPGIFDRNKPLSSIDISAHPKARQDILLQRLATAGYKRGPKKVVPVNREDVIDICFGKMISRALYHTVKTSINYKNKINLNYDTFMRIAITKTIEAAKSGNLPNHWAHIQSQKTAFI